LSIAKKGRKGLDGDRSSLFWEYVRIRKELNPKWFVLENVASMPKKDRDIITAEMGVEPILINAALVSAQCRKRLFWTNIPNVGQPEDRGIVLRDILQPDDEIDQKFVIKRDMTLSSGYKKQQAKKVGYIGEGEQNGQGGQAHRVYSEDGKTPTLSSWGPLVQTFTETAQTGRNETKKLGYVGEHDHQGKRVYDDNGKLPALNVAANSMVGTFVIGRDIGRRLNEEGTRKDDDKTLPIQRRIEMRTDDKSGTLTSVQKDNQVVNLQAQIIRKLTPIESERLQSLPDGYTEGICISQRYRCLGNAFNVEVVRHILNQIVS
jgi:DNA (cytosine-5)-methyltransferase 3A